MADQEQQAHEADQAEIQVKLDEICVQVEQSLSLAVTEPPTSEESSTVPPTSEESSTVPPTSDETTLQGADESDSQYEDIDEDEDKEKVAESGEKSESGEAKEEAKEGEASDAAPKNPAIIPKKGRFYEHDIRGGNDDDDG